VAKAYKFSLSKTFGEIYFTFLFMGGFILDAFVLANMPTLMGISKHSCERWLFLPTYLPAKMLPFSNCPLSFLPLMFRKT